MQQKCPLRWIIYFLMELPPRYDVEDLLKEFTFADDGVEYWGDTVISSTLH